MGYWGTGPTDSDQSRELYANCVQRGIATLMVEANLEPEDHWLRIGAVVVALRDSGVGIPQRWIKQLVGDIEYLESIDFGATFFDDKRESHQRWRDSAAETKRVFNKLLGRAIKNGYPDTVFGWPTG